MSTFVSDIRQWNSHVDFRNHLRLHRPSVCGWVEGVVVHHTWKPRVTDWRGLRSMEALRRHYISIGWTSAPHLFIARGSPNPLHDGIFQLTPLNMRGTHAGVCNSTTIGIEVVGDYDNAPWSELLNETVILTIAHFLDWRGLPSTAIRGHRDCNSPKTCPGKAISIPKVILDVEAMRNRLDL